MNKLFNLLSQAHRKNCRILFGKFKPTSSTIIYKAGASELANVFNEGKDNAKKPGIKTVENKRSDPDRNVYQILDTLDDAGMIYHKKKNPDRKIHIRFLVLDEFSKDEKQISLNLGDMLSNTFLAEIRIIKKLDNQVVEKIL